MQKVYLQVDGRTVGVLQNRTLKRRFRASKHMLRKPPALCIDVKLYDAYRPLFDAIEYIDEDSGRVYRIDAAPFDKYRFVIQRGGFAPQYACPLKYWQVYDPKAQQLSLMGV